MPVIFSGAHEYTKTSHGHLFSGTGMAVSVRTIGPRLCVGFVFAHVTTVLLCLFFDLSMAAAAGVFCAAFGVCAATSVVPEKYEFVVEPQVGVGAPGFFVPMASIVNLDIERHGDSAARVVLYTTADPIILTPFIRLSSARDLVERMHGVVDGARPEGCLSSVG